MNISPSSSSSALVPGPFTRPLYMDPNTALSPLQSRPNNELWRQKQQEIRELQEASQNLLRLSANSQSSTLPDAANAGNLFGSSVDKSRSENLVTSQIVPLSLMSTQAADLSVSMPLLPAVSMEMSLDDASSLRSASSTLAPKLGLRQSLSNSCTSSMALPLEQSRSSLLSINGHSKHASANADLQAENVALRAEVLELRQAAAGKDQELQSHSAISRELRARVAEADRRIAELTDEVDRLRKTGAMVELLEGDGPVHKVVRGYIENDMATMRAERRIAEQTFRAEVQDWQERAQQFQVDLQIANEKLRQLGPNGDFQNQLDSLKASAESQQKSLEEERRKVKREFAKKTSEAQHRGDECREEAEQAAAKTKEVERTMHARLSEARQEKQRIEGRFKKQVLALQNEVQESRLMGSELQEELAQRGNNSEFHEALSGLQEECSALSKRCSQETRKNEALQHMMKRESSEARQRMEMELLKEHSRAHDEAWERLSVVEERHAAQIKELQTTHNRELRLVAETVNGRGMERRTGVDAVDFYNDSDLRAVCAQKTKDVVTLEVSIRELRSEVAKAREDANYATKQHDSLLEVLRREREVADTQFQQLVRNTEEKQKAIGRLHHELDWEDGTDAPSPERPHSISTTWSSNALAAAAHHAHGSEAGVGLPESPVGQSYLDVAHREGGVDVMLKTLSIERDSQEARRCLDDLRRLLSVASPVNMNSTSGGVPVALNSSETLTPMDWQSQAQRLLEKLHSIYERVSKHVAEENMRIQAGYDREVALKERVAKAEAKMQRKHEQALQHAKSHGLDRLRSFEAEVMQTESALQAAFDGERLELQREMNCAKEALNIEAVEFNSVRKKCDVVIAAEAVAIKCSVDAAEAKVAADMRVEIGEMQRSTQAEIADGVQSHQNEMSKVEGNMARLEEDHAKNMARLEEDHANYRRRLELEESEERAQVRSELEQLSQVLHKELSATRDEHTAFVRREARLEARVDGVRHDCSEAETELQRAHSQLERNVESKSRQLEDLELALQAATRLSTTTQNEWSTDRMETEAELEQLVHRHAEDREMLAREVTQFQEEKLILEDKLRQNEVDGLAKMQAMQQELDDAEIALQRAEAVSEERLHLLEFARERRLASQRRGSVSTNGDSSPSRSSPPPKRRPTALMQTSMIQELESQVQTMSEEYEQKLEEHAEDFLQQEKHLKEQLGKLREDKVRERQMKDRQIDKLKSRVTELEKNGEVVDRKQASEAAQHRRQIDEFTQQIDKVKSEKRHLGGSLQETQAERARITSENDELRQELNLAEDILGRARNQCQELVAERYTQEQNASAWKADRESIVLARDNALRAVQDLEMQRELSRREVANLASEAQEACISTERLTQALDSELQQLLPMLPDAEARQLEDVRGPGGVPSETAVVGTFHALARFVADLARQNAELRCGPDRPRRISSHDEGNSHDKRQLALLQKEIVKLREETQELRLENRHLISQVSESRHRLGSHAEDEVNERPPVSPGAASRVSGSIAASVISESRSLDAQHSRPRQPPQPAPAAFHTDNRLKMKQLHAEKVKAETDLITYKQELSRKTNDMLAENDRLQSLLWDQQQEKQKAEENHRKKAGQLERKVRALEGKLQERIELEKQLAEEKYCVEEQLNLAAKQLENLLVEEHKDGDLQRDLAGLSRQFEQLHVKHRAQLAKTAEQGQVLEREREKRSQVEEALSEANAEIENEAYRHAEQMNSMQEQVTSLWKKVEAKEREVQEAVAEQTAMTCETSTLRSKQQQQELSTKGLQDEVRRLHEELAQQHELLRDALEKGPGATGALQKLRMKEHELDDTQQALQASEAALQRAQAEARARAMEIEDLRRANENLREELKRRFETSQPEGWQRHSLSQQEPQNDSAISMDRASYAAEETSNLRSGDQAYPDSSRISRRAQDLIGEVAEVCVVRTVADAKAETADSSRSSQLRGDDVVQNPPGQASLLSALEEIQETLNSREKELQHHKSGQPDSSRPVGMEGATSFSKVANELDLASISPHASLADVERNFAEAALAHGIHGDQVSRLWKEANARAEALDCHALAGYPSAQPQPRSAPIATDVDLKGSLETGAAVRGGGYPESPSAPAVRRAEAFLTSHGHEDILASSEVPASSSTSRWPKHAGMEPPSSESAAAQESFSPAASEEQASKMSSSISESAQVGLPSNARELFRRAEALCERHKFSEAVPCFHQVLQLLESGDPDCEPVPPVVVAEVWAHLGVAMQSLDRVREAIDSYRKAVSLDESLHVCFANLATLHAYLSEHEAATEYITKAMRLDPSNPTYVQIRRHLDESPGQQSENAQSKAEEAQ